jgi:hypothetical protein
MAGGSIQLSLVSPQTGCGSRARRIPGGCRKISALWLWCRPAVRCRLPAQTGRPREMVSRGPFHEVILPVAVAKSPHCDCGCVAAPLRTRFCDAYGASKGPVAIRLTGRPRRRIPHGQAEISLRAPAGPERKPVDTLYHHAYSLTRHARILAQL